MTSTVPHTATSEVGELPENRFIDRELSWLAFNQRVLEAALALDPGNRRYVFYLAQSYRDAGEREVALVQYDRRAAMGGWDEEVWYSLYQSALLAERGGRALGRTRLEVIALAARAFHDQGGEC